MLGVSKNPCTMVHRPVLEGEMSGGGRGKRITEHPQGHSSPGNYSPWIDHFHTHTHTHTHTHRVSPCHPEWTTTSFSLSHLPEVFDISSQHTKKSWSQARQSPMETFWKKSVTALSFSHFSFICLPPGWTTVQCPFSESKRRHICPLKLNCQDPLTCPSSSHLHVILPCRVRGSAPRHGKELSLWTWQILCPTWVHLPWAELIWPCSLLQGQLLPLDY